jgi:hypothetical protein
VTSFKIKDDLSFEENWAAFGEQLKELDEPLAKALLTALSACDSADAGAVRDAVYAACADALRQGEGK